MLTALLVAAVPLAAVLVAPASRLPGFAEGDVYKHAWSYWHTLQVLDSWPRTEWLLGPRGGVMLDVMLVPALLLAPITALAGPVVAANLGVWLLLVVGGLASGALAWRETRSEPGAVLAVLLTILAPYLAGYPLASGVHERLAVGVFPALLWALRDGRGWTTWAASVGLGLVALGCQVYAVVAVIVVGVTAPWWHRSWQETARTAVVLGVPMLLSWAVVHYTTAHPDALVPQAGRLSVWPGWPDALGVQSRPVSELVVAGAGAVARTDGDRILELAQVGAVPLLAAGLGAAHTREVRWVAGGAAVLCVLALGPVLSVGPWRAWNPVYAVAALSVPAWRTIPVPWQAVGAAVPLVAVAAAGLVARRRQAWLWAAAVGLLAFAERAVLCPVPVVLPVAPATVPAIYNSIVGPGVVVDIPRVRGDSALSPGEPFLAQTVHQHAISGTINAGTGALDFYLPVLRGVSSDWDATGRCLGALGVGYVVLHRELLSPGLSASEVVAAARRGLGDPIQDDGERAVFALSPSGTADLPAPKSTMVEALLDQGLVGGPVPRAGAGCPAQGVDL